MREPAVAGRFYPSDRDALKEAVRECFLSPLASGLPDGTGHARRVRGAMAPHAGIMISGPNAANVYRRIREDGLPEAYVMIGPDHHGMSPVNTFSSNPYATPLGVCRVHEGIADRLSRMIPDVPQAQEYEHSIEVQLPFVQFIDRDPAVIPVMMSDQSPAAAVELAHALGEACDGYDVLFIASTDMSHYIPRGEAARLDSMVLDRVADMDWRGVYSTVVENRISMCGYGPTATVMMLCEGCVASNVRHTDSYDTLGMDPDSVVGYGSAVFEV
ncbi:MAG: AmmeMemoRadiSam system protein B [Thermoplasmata archaeon]|nr:AmmeMemoRadiSam system protein B [Thermoplasmata archaeon]